MAVDLGSQQRFYRLNGLVFRVRLDRLEQGAEYLRNDRWVWTPITSGSVIADPHSRELSEDESEPFRS